MLGFAKKIEKISRAESKIELSKAVSTSFDLLKFPSSSITCYKPDNDIITEVSDINNWNQKLSAEYSRHEWSASEANYKRILRAGTPFTWNVGMRRQSVKETALLLKMKSAGIRSGLVMPLPSPSGSVSGVFLGSSEVVSLKREDLLEIFAIANTAVMKLELLGECRWISADHAHHLRTLTIRQKDILRWAAEGKSNTDIAEIIGISKAGVDYHMREICVKLGVATKLQAVALSKGEI